MKEFAGKVAGITGAANGIGEAFALEAARRGMNLATSKATGCRRSRRNAKRWVRPKSSRSPWTCPSTSRFA